MKAQLKTWLPGEFLASLDTLSEGCLTWSNHTTTITVALIKGPKDGKSLRACSQDYLRDTTSSVRLRKLHHEDEEEEAINNVHLVDHRSYMRNVITQTMRDVEAMGWCNLKIPEIPMVINEEVLNWPVSGTVYFRNGFVVSIQRLELRNNDINQIWSWTNRNETGTVEVIAPILMHGLMVGFDVDSHLNDVVHHSTATFVHDLITCTISIFRDTHTGDTRVTVGVTHPTSTNKLTIMPSNNITQVIRTLYDANSTFTGITGWGPEILAPMILDVVTNKIDFPEVCYDCPVT
ncbi:uncharacterized protein ACR2FA_010784 [Aphomia sociella]